MAKFCEADIKRLIKSAQAGGFQVEILEVVLPDGTLLRVISRKAGETPAPPNPWEEDNDNGA